MMGEQKQYLELQDKVFQIQDAENAKKLNNSYHSTKISTLKKENNQLNFAQNKRKMSN